MNQHGYTMGLDTPSKTKPQISPVSPLIHSHFRSASNASRSSRGDSPSVYEESSFMDMGDDNPRDVFARDGRDSFDSRNSNIYDIYAPDAQQRFKYDEDQNSSLDSASALRDSWQSGSVHDLGKRSINQSALRNVEGQQYVPVFAPEEPSSPSSPVPAVVITSPDDLVPRAGGRVPIVRNVGAVSNYSRPVRGSSGEPEDRNSGHNSEGTMMIPGRPRHNSSAAPVLDADVFDPESKRRVLERNINSASPSPNGSKFKFDSPSRGFGSPTSQTNSNTPPPPMVVVDPPDEAKSKADHYLQLGIKHHEANRLQESAICFEKSAKEGGGCGVGMLMWGLTLRHGWGCKKDEKGGFVWVRRAAEGAVADLERARLSGGTGDLAERGVVKAELVLAIYEVGQCFFHGWGVVKDQKMGVSYYRVAARLGDADAQNDLGFCLANGKGCKKDRKEAAKWYRAASVVRNLHKSYKAYFSNPADPDDSSFEPESYPYVDLEYPNNAATERFLLLAPKDKDHYNPIMDLEQTLYTIVDYYLTPSQRALIGNVPSDLLTETVSPPLSPSPSPPNSTASHASSGSMSSLTSLESSSHNEFPQPRVNYCRAVQRAINTKDGPLFIKTIKKINSLLSSFKYPTPPSDPFEPVPKNSLKERVATWSNSGGLPSKVLMRIIDENYQRCVGPHINKLRKYEAFTSKVYGEILPSLVHEILSLTKLNQDSLFMDLGSGVGNVVIQSALQTGCKSYGIELVEGPAQVAKEMAEQFKARCRMWGVACGEIELEEGDMLESPRVAELLPKADVVLVDNKVFEEKLNEALRPKFLDLKEGAIVISLKPFVSSLNGLNARVTERNVDDISAIFDVTERPYYPGSVSWGNNGGSYYIHRVDRVGYAEIRQKFESTTRGRRSAATAKYTPSKNTDESDWFGQ
ncbi:hypothetical protein HHX47_DHR9000438 [Lentinula edodes]|nr:hypothetical protein HHX47_DHR9000438 [Lentinula edodes]